MSGLAGGDQLLRRLTRLITGDGEADTDVSGLPAQWVRRTRDAGDGGALAYSGASEGLKLASFELSCDSRLALLVGSLVKTTG